VGSAFSANRANAAASCHVVVGYHLVSLGYQSNIWREAARLARTSVEQFASYTGSTEPVYIPNLPYIFEQGPYVLKSYAFGFYFHGLLVPPVRADALVLSWENGRISAVRTGPEPFSQYAGKAPAERTLILNLPIEVRR
jgi:hypothetical protein